MVAVRYAITGNIVAVNGILGITVEIRAAMKVITSMAKNWLSPTR